MNAISISRQLHPGNLDAALVAYLNVGLNSAHRKYGLRSKEKRLSKRTRGKTQFNFQSMVVNKNKKKTIVNTYPNVVPVIIAYQIASGIWAKVVFGTFFSK